jgi:hypothetical protein
LRETGATALTFALAAEVRVAAVVADVLTNVLCATAAAGREPATVFVAEVFRAATPDATAFDPARFALAAVLALDATGDA